MSRQTCPPEVKQPRRVCLENKILIKVSKMEHDSARNHVNSAAATSLDQHRIKMNSIATDTDAFQCHSQAVTFTSDVT